MCGKQGAGSSSKCVWQDVLWGARAVGTRQAITHSRNQAIASITHPRNQTIAHLWGLDRRRLEGMGRRLCWKAQGVPRREHPSVEGDLEYVGRQVVGRVHEWIL